MKMMEKPSSMGFCKNVYIPIINAYLLSRWYGVKLACQLKPFFGKGTEEIPLYAIVL